MKHRIIEAKEFKIIGIKAQASFATNAKVTPQLAREFIPKLKDIKERKDSFTLSLQNYTHFNFKDFNPNTPFEKWVGVEVNNFDIIPQGLETIKILSGNYLVIDFTGSIPEFIQLWQHIHSAWLPHSEYELDNRPHFERLPASYNPMNPINNEEIWIPVK